MTGPTPPVGVELLPDWTPSMDPRLVRLDAVVKVGAGARIAPGTALAARLVTAEGVDRTITLSADLGGLTGPDWREVRGRILEVDPAVSAAVGVLGDRVSAPVFRHDGRLPVLLAPIRDRIGVADEPLLWWRYYNATGHALDVGRLRAGTRLWADGWAFRLSATYNGPAQLPPGRAISGLWLASDLAGLPPGTYRMRLVADGRASGPVPLTV